MLREAESVSYGGYRNEWGTCTVFFTINGVDYEYDMDCQDADTVNWLSKKSPWKALGLAKKRCWKWRKKSVTAPAIQELKSIAEKLSGQNLHDTDDTR